jgi:hypothetical protein
VGLKRGRGVKRVPPRRAPGPRCRGGRRVRAAATGHLSITCDHFWRLPITSDHSRKRFVRIYPRGSDRKSCDAGSTNRSLRLAGETLAGESERAEDSGVLVKRGPDNVRIYAGILKFGSLKAVFHIPRDF